MRASASRSIFPTMSRLYRSNDQRIFLGVCGGLAQRYGWDPVWVRIAFIAGVLLGGPGILAYAVMALVVPRNPALTGGSATALGPGR